MKTKIKRTKTDPVEIDVSYMCSECGKLFKTRTELTLHTNSKCGTIKQFKCNVCEKQLMTPGSLHNHMLRHSGTRTFMCGFCAKLFLTAGQLKVHERRHTLEKAFVCDVCGKGFCHRQSLITHSTLHTGIKPFQCENCGNSFSCIGNLIKHRRTHSDTCGVVPLTTHRVEHPATKLKVKINTPEGSRLRFKANANARGSESDSCEFENGCNVVEENFSEEETEKTFQSSSPVVVVNDNKDFVSAEIESTTATGRNSCINELQTKVDVPKRTKKPSHKCFSCSETFKTKKEHTTHQQQNHADTLTCYDCDRIFANIHSLRTHQNVSHKGIPRKMYLYVCEKCGKQFRQKLQLTHHEQNNCGSGPKFQCEVCKKHFSTVHTRRSHMRVHDPEKKLLCKFCGKSFHWKGQLKIHERSHTGEKPFTCLYCPKAFAYRESLLTHSSLHTGIKPHLCEACGLRFSCLGNLIKHRVSHASTCGVWYAKNKA